MIIDFLLDVSSICELHYYAQSLCLVIKKGLSIVDDVRMRDRGKYPHLVQSILALLFLHLPDFDLDLKKITFFIA